MGGSRACTRDEISRHGQWPNDSQFGLALEKLGHLLLTKVNIFAWL